MHHFIVIGNPINHSKSPIIHHEFARQIGLDICYNRQFCPNDFASFVAVVEAFFNGGGIGANVTLPFKEWAFKLCDERGNLSNFAKSAKAVNTLTLRNGKLYGDNTDGRGLVADLSNKGIALHGKHIAILGAGGATRGAILPLLNSGATITIFNRTLSKAQSLMDDFQAFNSHLTARSLDELTGEFELVINATSATTNEQPLPLNNKTITSNYAYDMAYGKHSEFITQFKNQGAVCFDGMGMLIHQALLSFELWTRVDIKKIDLELIENLLI